MIQKDKRGKGKPKGSPKSGGRQKNTVNRLTADFKTLITESNPVQFLIDAYELGYIKGNVSPKDSKERYLTLTLKERCDIAIALAKKIVPDMKSTDITSKGEQIKVTNELDQQIINQFLKEKKDEL